MPTFNTTPTVPVLQSDTFEIQRQKINNMVTNLTTVIDSISSDLSTNGYYKLPGGLIIQWGTFTPSTATSPTLGSPTIVQLPIAFPTKLVFAIAEADGGYSSSDERCIMDWSTSGKTTLSQLGIYTTVANAQCKFIAIGY